MPMIILFALLQASLFAWDEVTVLKWEQLSQNYSKQFTDATFSTFWGGVRRGLHWKDHRGSLIQVESSRFDRPIPVYVSSKSTKKDLIIFYPGVFGKPDGRISPQVIDELEQEDVHVAVIPNIVAPTYLQAKRMSGGDAVINEMANQKVIVEAIIRSIREKNISKIHIVAESLGALQALITFLPENRSPMIHSLTLIWPPLYLDRALKRFDHLIERTSTIYEGCTLWWKWPWVLKEVKFSGLPENLSHQDKICFGSWVISQAFVSSIQSTTEEVFDSKKLILKNDPKNFTEFVEFNLPDLKEALRRGDGRFTFLHLLGHYRPMFPKLRLVSSSDDFLNDPKEWEELWIKYPDLRRNHYLFNWGGHSGPASSEGFFKELLRNISPNSL